MLPPNTRFEATAQNSVASLPFWVRSLRSPAPQPNTLGCIVTATPREVFLNHIKEYLAPKLRLVAFKGSGQNFLRVRGELINAVNIQGSRWGEAACVNLGLHFTFLPQSWRDDPQTTKKWREVDCEFRARLSPRRGYDHWWKYGSSHAEAKRAAEDVVETYFSKGEALFELFEQPTAIVSAVTLGDRRIERSADFVWHATEVRLALAIARIHQHLGNMADCRANANFGLSKIRRAERLRSPLEALANAT
jgi:Domain of unknown function (DUF4304)